MEKYFALINKNLVQSVAVGNDDFISHGKNGFLLDPRNPEEWAETIDRLLQNDELRQSVGQAAKNLVEEKCDIRKTAKKIEAIYQELM